MNNCEFTLLHTDDQLSRTVGVIREAFATVAAEFNLNEENCPTHPSLITKDRVDTALKKGARFYGLFHGTEQVGCVALEEGPEGVYYLERLAVLPAWRRRGYGKELVRSALAAAESLGARRVSIGIIDEDRRLKNWYRSLGFRETGTRKYGHLPFAVCFMEKDIAELCR